MIPTITLLTVALGLGLDATFPGFGQAAANGLAVAAFLLVYRLARREEKHRLLVCLTLATAGEAVLCLGWGLYEYRHGNLPIFVPPGHALLFFTGCRLAERMPQGFWKLAVVLIAPAALFMALSGRDTSGLLFLPVFLVCLLPPANRNLYATMILLALALELAGTALGSWRWSPAMPVLNLTQTNPPLLAGVFYCLLDLLVMLSSALVNSDQSPDRPRFASSAVSVTQSPDSS